MPKWRLDERGRWQLLPEHEREELISRMDELFLGCIGAWILLGVTVLTVWMVATGGLP